MIKLLNILKELKLKPEGYSIIKFSAIDSYESEEDIRLYMYEAKELPNVWFDDEDNLSYIKAYINKYEAHDVTGWEDMSVLDMVKDLESILTDLDIPFKVIQDGEEYKFSINKKDIKIINNIQELKIRPESDNRLIAAKIYIGSDNYLVYNLNSTYYESWYRDKNDSLTFVVKQDASGELDVKEHFEEITNEIKSLDIPYTYTYDDYEDEYYVKVSAYYINYKN